MRARLFWLISRTAVFLYRRFPIFGPIPGSVAVVRRDNHFLVIERSDGYGLSLPGGLARPFENAEDALHREVREETGLTITSAELKYDFVTSYLYPTHTRVFETTVEGEIRGSWEGRPRFVSLQELEQEIMPTQRPILRYLNGHNPAVCSANK